MDGRETLPQGTDVNRASVARVYDALLGGTQNFQVDRDLAHTLEAVDPMVRAAARANRAFLARAVRFLLKAGVRQFLDLGSGIPTMGNVHEIAQAIAPTARVVYVDSDPVAAAHSKALLLGNPNAASLQADLREPAAILRAPVVRDLIDFDEPVAVLLVTILHFIPEAADPVGITSTLRDALPVGGYLAISHLTHERNEQSVLPMAKAVSKAAVEVVPRSRAQILRFFKGFTLVDPGLVYLPLWRPEPGEEVPEHPERYLGLAGVGAKRG